MAEKLIVISLDFNPIATKAQCGNLQKFDFTGFTITVTTTEKIIPPFPVCSTLALGNLTTGDLPVTAEGKQRRKPPGARISLMSLGHGRFCTHTDSKGKEKANIPTNFFHLQVRFFIFAATLTVTLATFGKEHVHIRIHVPEIIQHDEKKVIKYEDHGGHDHGGGGGGGGGDHTVIITSPGGGHGGGFGGGFGGGHGGFGGGHGGHGGGGFSSFGGGGGGHGGGGGFG
ncbi:hypothetical protein K0M31_010239, partial [Melipona bicolor]